MLRQKDFWEFKEKQKSSFNKPIYSLFKLPETTSPLKELKINSYYKGSWKIHQIVKAKRGGRQINDRAK